MIIGNRMLPRYGHRYSRHDFQFSQLFACLVLRKFFRVDYRGIVAILDDCPAIKEILGLKGKTPHFTTLQKAEHRLLTDKRTRGLLTESVAMFHQDEPTSPEADNIAYVIELACPSQKPRTPCRVRTYEQVHSASWRSKMPAFRPCWSTECPLCEHFGSSFDR